jgi:hypothetical protein
LIVIVAVALAGLAVVVAVVLLASGMGGELADSHPDHPPLPLPGNRPIAGTDAALLRLPTGVWGYHTRVTDEALRRLSYALTERDTRIAILEQQTAELRQKLESLEAADTTARTSDGWQASDERAASWTPPAESLEFESRPGRGRAGHQREHRAASPDATAPAGDTAAPAGQAEPRSPSHAEARQARRFDESRTTEDGGG